MWPRPTWPSSPISWTVRTTVATTGHGLRLQWWPREWRRDGYAGGRGRSVAYLDRRRGVAFRRPRRSHCRTHFADTWPSTLRIWCSSIRPGTGYSRIVAKGDDARRRLWSVNGDIDTLAEVLRRWLDHNDRIVSPKYILGESYGGFRGPRLARALQSDQGVGVSGMVLISPLLDAHVKSGYNGRSSETGWVDLLPSEVAAALRAARRKARSATRRPCGCRAICRDRLSHRHAAPRHARYALAVARMTDRVVALTGVRPRGCRSWFRAAR